MRVAKVIIDIDIPHLDRPFDYLVPASMLQNIEIGSLVRVKWGHTRHNGWVVGFSNSEDDTFNGELSSLLKLLSHEPLFSLNMLETYRYLSLRYCVNLSQVLSLAIPKRIAKVEKTPIEKTLSSSSPKDYCLPSSLNNKHGVVQSFITVDKNNLCRAAILAVPNLVREQLLSLASECLSHCIPLIILVPTFTQAEQIHEILNKDFDSTIIGLYGSELPDADRYTTHLLAKMGKLRVVIGTRSAVWIPFSEPSYIAIWDEGTDLYREKRNPRIDVLDIAMARCVKEKYGLLAISYSRSIKAQALVESGWATDIRPNIATLRQQTTKVLITGTENFDRDGSSSFSILPDSAFYQIRQALTMGPALVQVASAGKFLILNCPNCGSEPKKRTTSLDRSHAPAELFTCPSCSFSPLGEVQVGAEKIGRELGRAFPQIPIIVSAASSQIRRSVDQRPQIVVATSGAEPVPENGYSTVIISEPEVTAYSGRLSAEEDALRRWMNTLSLARSGSVSMICGQIPPLLSRALISWKPVEFISLLLAEREELGFFPAQWWVGIEGDPKSIAVVVDELDHLNDGANDKKWEIRAIIPLPTDQHGTQIGVSDNDKTLPPVEAPALFAADLVTEPTKQNRALVTCLPKDSTELMRVIRTIVVKRSLQREPPIKVSVNSADLFEY